MSFESDNFAAQLMEEAKRFLEIAKESDSGTTPEQLQANLHAALFLGFSALEAQLNAVSEELLLRSDLSILDRSILAEMEFRLKNGEWDLTSTQRFYRLDDRIAFIFKRFTSDNPKTMPWWSPLSDAIKKRNSLVHPRDVVDASANDIERALRAAIDAIDAIYRGVFGAGYPPQKRGLHSTMTF